MDAGDVSRGPRGRPGKAIVLGGHYGGLSVVRALGREGIRVMVVASDHRVHASHSRFASKLVVAPDPSGDSDGLLRALLETDPDWSGALLVPTLDEYVVFVSRYKAELEERFAFAVPGREVIDHIVYKNLHYAAARQAGVPTPEFLVPDSVSSLEVWRDADRFPCILKPYESRRFSEIYGRKVLVAGNLRELTEKYLDTQANGLDVMVCEIIPGDDDSIFSYHSYIDSRGDLLAEMCSQKLRQYPPGFGQGSVVRTVPMIDEIRRLALDLLRFSGYRGESSAEFRLDRRDGRYKLMEINSRPIVTERLFVMAGVNFPYITYRDLVDDVRVAPEGYDTDLHWIHNHWEPVNLVRRIRAGNLDLKEFLGAYGKRRVYVVPVIDDPVHFMHEVAQNGRLAFKRLADRG
jgi:D-aspartate ligase